jgi:hypothetical protein
MHGIKKDIEPIINIEKYGNSPLNRYIKHQIIRLNKYLENPEKY